MMSVYFPKVVEAVTGKNMYDFPEMIALKPLIGGATDGTTGPAGHVQSRFSFCPCFVQCASAAFTLVAPNAFCKSL